MPSRNQKKRSKQRAEYLQKREDILSQENKAKARARYKADPEKKKASVRDTYKADPEKKKASAAISRGRRGEPCCYRYQEGVEENRAAKRQRYQEGVEENRAAKRQRYQEGVEENRAAKRQRYQEDVERTVLLKGSDIKRASRRTVLLKGSDIKRASRRTVLLKGGYTGAIQLPLRQLEGVGIGRVVELPLPPKEYGVRLEKAILRDSELLSEVNNAFCNSHPLLAQKVVTRSARAVVSKISADALLAKALSVRRSQAGSLLKAIRKVNAKKLQESDILVGHRFHTAGAEPYFFDNSKSVEGNRAAKRQRYQEDVEENRAAKRQRYQEDVKDNHAAKRQRYQEDVEENRAAKRQKYEDNSAAIKASERNRYWNDPAVRLAKRAAEGKRYRRGHRTTTTTQRVEQ
eukprot:Em0001g2460a